MSIQPHDGSLTAQERAILGNYLHLTPENQQKVTAYLAALAASQRTPAPFSDSQR